MSAATVRVPMLIEATSQTVLGNVYYLTGNDDVNVAFGVTITSLGESPNHDTEYDAITTFMGQHRFTVSGTINGYDDGINTIGCETAQTVEILAGGVINSGWNSPVVDADGVILDGLGSTLVNRGTINAQGSGVMLSTREFGTTTVTNHGTINAEKYGIWVQYSVGAAEFINLGRVESGMGSYFGGVKVDLVTNAGTMIGDIDLREGNDVYIGTGGTVVGRILGGSGDDRFVPGASAEQVDGGDGCDTLDFSGLATPLRVYLDTPGLNRGAAVLGDTYAGIDNIYGSSFYDTLSGNGSNNLLSGGGGTDRLFGGAGADTLIGGWGADVLTGGADGDVFQIERQADCGDILADFQSSVDLIRLEGSAFGYGNHAGGVAASAFVSSAAGVALDSNDRFIFNTTTTALWYDRDGSGARAAILVADLAEGSSLDFWDINIF